LQLGSPSSNRFTKSLKAVFLSGLLVALPLYLWLEHSRIEERGSLHFYDRIVLTLTVPFEKAGFFIRDSLSQVTHRYFLLVGVEKENEQLRREIANLKRDEIFLKELQGSQERLTTLLGLKKKMGEEWLGARVVAFPPLGTHRLLTIDQGSRAGIQRRSPVVSPGGLVGQVARVFENFSQVLLITDPTSAVDARVEGSEARGLVVGQVIKLTLKRDLFLTAFEYVNRMTTLVDGASIVTTGLDGVYPAGVLVGTVREKTAKRFDIFRAADVIPAVDFYRLKEVLVLKKP